MSGYPIPCTDARAEIERLRDPQQRLAALVERARRRPELPLEYRTDANRVPGCQVRTWWVAEQRPVGLWFGLDSDAVTLKALGGFLCEQASGLPSRDLVEFDATIFERWGVLRQLADNRRATVLRIAEQIRAFAIEKSGGGLP